MAGPSIVVRVLGDLTGLSKSVTDAGSKASGAADKLHTAFSGVLGTLNKTGVLGGFGDALDGANDALEQISEHGKEVGQVMLGVGGTLAGVGVGLQAIGSKDAAAHAQLQAAVTATGHSYDDYEKQVEAAIKTQEKFGDSADETQNALAALTEATNDPAKALQLLGTATDLAAAKHESLVSAATDLGKVYNGNTKLLKQFGIVIAKQPNYSKAAASAAKQEQTAQDNLAHAKRTLADIEEVDAGKKKLTVGQSIQLRNAEEAVQTAVEKSKTAHQNLTAAQDAAKTSAGNQTSAVTLLGQKLAGQASAAADTFGGKLDALKAKFEDQAAELGQKYGPAITAAGAALTGLGAALEVARAGVAALRTVELSDIPIEIAMIAPIIAIVAALAALGVAAYLIYRNWGTIWKGMKAAAVDVWTWIRQNWPLLLAIILGPITTAAYEAYKHWATIKQGAVDVWNWLKTTWSTVTGYITAPFTAAFKWITGPSGWGAVTGWFSKLPGDIARLASGMWDGVANSFVDAVNFIVNTWNDLKFKTPSFKLPFPPHTSFPSVTIGVPHINDLPHLAQGGLITGSGIVYAHAGEVITPAPAASRSGPAVVVQNATFSQGIDIDLFMKKAAWVAKTARI